jgi:hypothetical protein
MIKINKSRPKEPGYYLFRYKPTFQPALARVYYWNGALWVDYSISNHLLSELKRNHGDMWSEKLEIELTPAKLNEGK